MDSLYFTVDESAALMREVYPNYPDLRGPRPAPKDLAAWLEAHRRREDLKMFVETPRTPQPSSIKPPAGLAADCS